MRGAICGLTLDTSVEDLSLAYLACVQSLAYGIKHIHDEMKGYGTKAGYFFRSTQSLFLMLHTLHRVSGFSVVTMCGGLSKSDLFVQTVADVLELPVVKPMASQSAVVLGAAMLGAAAAKNGMILVCLD